MGHTPLGGTTRTGRCGIARPVKCFALTGVTSGGSRRQAPARMVGAMAAGSLPARTGGNSRAPMAAIVDQGAELVLRLAGDWVIEQGPPRLAEIRAALRAAPSGKQAAGGGGRPRRLGFAPAELPDAGCRAGAGAGPGAAAGRPAGRCGAVDAPCRRRARASGAAAPAPGRPAGTARRRRHRVRGRGRGHGQLRRRDVAGLLAAPARAGADAAARLLARRAAVRRRRAADHHPDQRAGRHDPGLRRRLAAGPVRRPGVRRQPGGHRHAARDGRR